MSCKLHWKNLEFPFTLVLHHNHKVIFVHEDDQAYSSLPVTDVCTAKGGHV